jgi:hypothetical protein
MDRFTLTIAPLPQWSKPVMVTTEGISFEMLDAIAGALEDAMQCIQRRIRFDPHWRPRQQIILHLSLPVDGSPSLSRSEETLAKSPPLIQELIDFTPDSKSVSGESGTLKTDQEQGEKSKPLPKEATTTPPS